MAVALGVASRARRRARTAAEIERVAMELFIEKGYDSVTTDEIAAAADISPRTLFRYFPAKEELLLAELRRRIVEFQDSLAARPPDEPALAGVRAAFRSLSRSYQRDRGAVLRWAAVVGGTSALLPVVAATQASFREPLAEFVAVRLGTKPSDLRPKIMATALLGASWAAYEQWIASGASKDLATLTERALDVLEAPSTWGE